MIDKNGKVVKTIMRSFSLGEISAVDRPAQAHATVAIMKRDGGTVPLAKFDASMALTTMTGGHSHLITMGGGDYKRRAGDTSYVDGHSHPWLMDEAGNVTVGHAQGHNHGIEIISKGEMSEAELKNLLSKEGAPATTEDLNKTAGNEPAEPIGTPEDQTMTPEEKKAAEEAAAKVAKAQQDELAKLQKRAERAEAVASMTDGHRAYFKNLKGEDAETFLAKTVEGRDEIVTKAAEANQVVFTAMDGTTYRKNDDARLIAMAKQLDEEKRARIATEALAKKASLEKRAEDLKHIPGTTEERVALLKGIDMLPEAERASAMKALQAQNERLGGAFKRIGSAAAPNTETEDSTLSSIDTLAAEIAKRDSITFEAAYTKALNTPEGQKLYNLHVEKRQAASSKA
jgi:hypothetical protein